MLAGRPEDGMDAVADDLRAAGATTVETVLWESTDPSSHQAVIDDVFDRFGDIDLVYAPAGILGSQQAFDADPAFAAAAVAINFGGLVSSSLAVVERFRRQGHGTLVVMSSVAGVRTRKDNYVYGSTKSGLDAFAQGLGDSLVGTGIKVMVVRPGFVKTKMTEGMDAAPFSTTPEKVAELITDGIAKGISNSAKNVAAAAKKAVEDAAQAAEKAAQLFRDRISAVMGAGDSSRGLSSAQGDVASAQQDYNDALAKQASLPSYSPPPRSAPARAP